MNPFEYSRAVTDFWTAQGQALMRAQEQAGAALAEGMKTVTAGKFPIMPEMPADLSAGAADLAQASKSVMDLWSAAASVCAKLTTVFPGTASRVGAADDGIAEATFRKIVDPRTWIAGGMGEMDDVLGRMTQGPRFADLWEAERRYAGVLQAWMNVRRRGLEHNAVVLGAWLQAGRRFAEQLTALAGAVGTGAVGTGAAGTGASRSEAGGVGAKTLDAKAALALWTQTANEQLLETQRSEAFLQSQAAMIRATTELRMAQQELVEHFGKQYGFPTRTEMDDVHRTVTELRREIRAMRREQRASAPAQSEASKQLVAASAALPKTRPAPRPGAKQRGADS